MTLNRSASFLVQVLFFFFGLVMLLQLNSPYVILLFFSTPGRSLHDLAYGSLELGKNVTFVEDDIEDKEPFWMIH
jgi:hypothetical protein